MGRADECVALGHGVCELRSYPKVCQLHLASLRQQDVAAFYVSVHLPQPSPLVTLPPSDPKCACMHPQHAGEGFQIPQKRLAPDPPSNNTLAHSCSKSPCKWQRVMPWKSGGCTLPIACR